ncbi:SSFA2 [Cervus elaphus hippelaphus]|uniref:SSFA2 n=1 Tax=Cervus elaphus hippelaphus TaxID=46360 RepID=A0A212C1N2_CEREH|nr:SSFA2 [Cervus elaphus hippelaphus]
MAPQAQAAPSPAEDLQRKDTATPDRGFFPGAASGLRGELTTASRRLLAGPSLPGAAGSRAPGAAAPFGSAYFGASPGQLGSDQKPQAEETRIRRLSGNGGRDLPPQARG